MYERVLLKGGRASGGGGRGWVWSCARELCVERRVVHEGVLNRLSRDGTSRRVGGTLLVGAMHPSRVIPPKPIEKSQGYMHIWSGHVSVRSREVTTSQVRSRVKDRVKSEWRVSQSLGDRSSRGVTHGQCGGGSRREVWSVCVSGRCGM